MAERPVFVPREGTPYYGSLNFEFVYSAGFAPVQKQKNIRALHAAYRKAYPEGKILEISSKSMQEGGVELSAFNLPLFVPSLGKSVSVECVYQSSKVFEHGGPYTDLLEGTSRDAKKDERLKTSGKLIGFRFEGRDYPLKPATSFYDFLYMNALLENEELGQLLLEYDAFTDIEFNPNKGISCQAAAAAGFVSLVRLGKIPEIRNYDSFRALLLPGAHPADFSPKPEPEPKSEAKPVSDDPELLPGMTLTHPKYGKGKIQRTEDKLLTVEFEDPAYGVRVLGQAWCRANCLSAGKTPAQEREPESDPEPEPEISPERGMRLTHPKFGKGVILWVRPAVIRVRFENPKWDRRTLLTAWCLQHCGFLPQTPSRAA